MAPGTGWVEVAENSWRRGDARHAGKILRERLAVDQRPAWALAVLDVCCAGVGDPAGGSGGSRDCSYPEVGAKPTRHFKRCGNSYYVASVAPMLEGRSTAFFCTWPRTSPRSRTTRAVLPLRSITRWVVGSRERPVDCRSLDEC